MSKHTPGPWKVYYRGAGGWRLQAGSAWSVDLSSAHLTEHDARLIAAAPEMLEACRAVLAYYTGGRIANPALDAARAAIAKAEGR